MLLNKISMDYHSLLYSKILNIINLRFNLTESYILIKFDYSHSRCRCCFNQPDIYCRQLECKNMHPDFGPNSNTSCICYDQSDYPRQLCSGYYSSAVILPPESSMEPYLLKEYHFTTALTSVESTT